MKTGKVTYSRLETPKFFHRFVIYWNTCHSASAEMPSDYRRSLCTRID